MDDRDACPIMNDVREIAQRGGERGTINRPGGFDLPSLGVEVEADRAASSCKILECAQRRLLRQLGTPDVGGTSTWRRRCAWTDPDRHNECDDNTGATRAHSDPSFV
jgi:hypothetical protein